MAPEPESELLRPLAGLDKLVHEPARLMAMAFLSTVESADFTFLLRQTGLTWGNLSSHLSKLEDAGYVEIEKGFVARRPHTMLRLTDLGRLAFETYLRKMKSLVNGLPE